MLKNANIDIVLLVGVEMFVVIIMSRVLTITNNNLFLQIHFIKNNIYLFLMIISMMIAVCRSNSNGYL